MNDCIFCPVAEGAAESWKTYETDSVNAFLDIQPANEYYTLVIPKKHYTSIFDMPEDEWVRVILALKHVVNLYHKKLGIKNLQIINCSGAEAQQDVFHLHFHIVPRYKGDQQGIRWSTHSETKHRFDHLLARLQ